MKENEQLQTVSQYELNEGDEFILLGIAIPPESPFTNYYKDSGVFNSLCRALPCRLCIEDWLYDRFETPDTGDEREQDGEDDPITWGRFTFLSETGELQEIVLPEGVVLKIAYEIDTRQYLLSAIDQCKEEGYEVLDPEEYERLIKRERHQERAAWLVILALSTIVTALVTSIFF